MTTSDVLRQAFRSLAELPDTGVAGTYTAPGGASVSVSYLTEPHDEFVAFWEQRARRAGWVVEVLAEDVTPVEGGLVQFDGDAYTVRALQLDGVRGFWRLALDPFVAPTAVLDDVSRPPVLAGVGLL